MCLIQLKLQEKHAAGYDAQIGSGYSVEVSDLFLKLYIRSCNIHKNDSLIHDCKFQTLMFKFKRQFVDYARVVLVKKAIVTFKRRHLYV